MPYHPGFLVLKSLTGAAQSSQWSGLVPLPPQKRDLYSIDLTDMGLDVDQ